MPEELSYIWAWYWELCGPELLTHVEIQAWQENVHMRLLPWEVRLIRSLSRKHQEVMHSD